MSAFQEEETPRNECGADWRGLILSMREHQWPWSGEFLMAAFDIGVCADESGIHDSAPLCIIAGYIASVNQWMWFDDRWNAVLEKHDVLDFHSTDFFAFDDMGKRVGQHRLKSDPAQWRSYGEWSETQLDDFIDGLLNAIDNSRAHPLGAYVETAAFWSFTHGERKYLTGGKLNASLKWVTSGAPSKPYFLLFDHCLAEAGHRTKEGKKALFVFDQQKEFQGRALQQFGESLVILSRDDPKIGKRFGGVIFQQRRDVPGLQAADLYTHCWYRHIAKPAQLGIRRKALDRLTATVPGMKEYTRDHMAGLFRNLPPDVRTFVRDYTEPVRPTSV